MLTTWNALVVFSESSPPLGTWLSSLLLQDAFHDHPAPRVWRHTLTYGLSGSGAPRTRTFLACCKVTFLLIRVIISPSGRSCSVEELPLVLSCTLRHLVLCLVQGNTNGVFRLYKMIFSAFPCNLPKRIGLIILFSLYCCCLVPCFLLNTE